MPRLSQWNLRKQNNYAFIDRHVSQFFNVSGTGIYVHKYLGPLEQGNTEDTDLREKDDFTQPDYENKDPAGIDELDIQDLMNLENRDRKYEKYIYELRGQYQVSDNDFDLKQFGFFLSADTIYLTFHLNEMVKIMGRKLLSGDVLELPHQRDEYLLDDDAPAVNKYYVVQDAQRAAEGYSSLWWPHIWRVKCTPMQSQQEFYDILLRRHENQYGEVANVLEPTLEKIISTHDIEIDTSNAIVNEAIRQVPNRFWENRHLYLQEPVNGKARYQLQYFDGDGVPPNGIPVTSGTAFPTTPTDLEFFLRTDYQPNLLFQRQGNIWARVEVDWRQKWEAANDKLVSFLNNNSTFNENTRTVKGKTNISKALKPKADF